MNKIFDIFDIQGDFTKTMNSSINKFTLDDDYDTSKPVDFLNAADNFKTFSEGLTEFISNHGYSDSLTDVDKKASFLFNKLSEQDIKISKSTIKDWFLSVRRPNTDIRSRENMYKICFSLNLSENETAKFFNNVYFDRYFNFRNINELIYYFCLKNNKSYNNALNLIEKVKRILETNETSENNATIFTNNIAEQTQDFKDDEQLIQYITLNKYNFEKNNVSSTKNLQELIEEAKSFAQIESESFILDTENMDKSSLDFMLYIIHGMNFTAIEKELKDYSFSKNANLLDIIRINYPSKSTLSNIINNKNISYDILRKAMILFKFYVFWLKAFKNKYIDNAVYKDAALVSVFISETNDLLYDTGLSNLYSGNPFDWIFLYCSTTHSPLDVFRDLISQVYYQEED